MRLPSPLIHCLLALTLASAQWVSGVHAFAHLAAPIIGDASADKAPEVPASRGAATQALVATTPSHVDDPACALCLAFGSAQAPVSSVVAIRSAPIFTAVVLPARGLAAPVEPLHARPPARGPPPLA